MQAEKHRRYYLKCKASLAELIKTLGGKCAKCPETTNLHVDHMDGRDWEPNELSYHQRVRRYWTEYRSGVRLRVLCARCNGWYIGARRGQ